MATNSNTSGWFSWLIPVVAVVLGSFLGAASARSKYQEPILELAQHEALADSSKTATLEDAKPIVHLPAPTTYEFGVMARGERDSHNFKVQNLGTGPLTLKVLDTTCKCTVGEIGKDSVAPGETVDVTLEWEAKSYAREFRQSATIETNDQGKYREIIFSVAGQVLQLAMPDTPLMKFSRVSRSEPQSFSTKVYGYRDRDLVITGHTFSDSELAPFFDITSKPLPKDEWEDKEAKSGIRVTVNIKPGLPLGRNRQIIALETNKADIASMDVAVEMTVVSDISVLGRASRFDDETNLLRFGSVDSKKGDFEQLFLMVKGKHLEDVEFSVASIDPEAALAVEIGDARPLTETDADGNETVVAKRFPLAVRVKPGSPVVRRLGSKQGELGKIVLNTKHPEVDKFDIKVQFSTQ